MKKRIISIVLTVAFALSCVSCFGLPQININTSGSGNKLLDTLGSMLEFYSYYEYDFTDEQMAKALVASYKEVTGDKYAFYYTEAEFKQMNDENLGKNQGIGVIIAENTEFGCIEIVSVLPESPAEKAGVKVGDLIAAVGIKDNAENVVGMDFDIVAQMVRGEVGTLCEFAVARNKDFSNLIEFSILREEFVSKSVIYAKSKSDPSIGIVKILQFDLVTPKHFCEAMESLIKDGCKKFIYDVRGNPGGDLNSVSAVLSRLYKSGDIIIRTEDKFSKDGEKEIIYCEPVGYKDDYADCSVSKMDIGKYRAYPAAVLVDANTASAAELFASGMKDYGLAVIVGETTYGKGSMQSIFSLDYFDLPGAIKMTTAYYYPPISDNYNGVGVIPNEGYNVVLSEEASNINIYTLLNESQELDNQLAAAIEALKNR